MTPLSSIVVCGTDGEMLKVVDFRRASFHETRMVPIRAPPHPPRMFYTPEAQRVSLFLSPADHCTAVDSVQSAEDPARVPMQAGRSIWAAIMHERHLSLYQPSKHVALHFFVA